MTWPNGLCISGKDSPKCLQYVQTREHSDHGSAHSCIPPGSTATLSAFWQELHSMQWSWFLAPIHIFLSQAPGRLHKMIQLATLESKPSIGNWWTNSLEVPIYLSIGAHDFVIPSSTDPVCLLSRGTLAQNCGYEHDIVDGKGKSFFQNCWT